MKQLTIDELKDLQVEMLEKIHQFCIANNIRYFIGYGTLLGAIRHKGYIPWDEDIDIGMPRPDYDKFLQTFNGTFDELEVNAPELDWNYFEPYANVYDIRTVLYEEDNPHHGIEVGVKIDVFPLDGVPSDWNEYISLRRHLAKLNSLRGQKKVSFASQLKKVISSGRGVRALLFRMAHPLCSYTRIQQKMRKLATQYDWDSSDYVDKITFQNSPETRLLRKVYETYIDVPFEGHLFKAPSDWDSHLKVIYGEYMKLPPVEQQVYKHGFTAYWKD